MYDSLLSNNKRKRVQDKCSYLLLELLNEAQRDLRWDGRNKAWVLLS